MKESAPDTQRAFAECATAALTKFSKTTGNCVALCAYVSACLKERSIPHKVALGSLSCNGMKTFQYKKPFPAMPVKSMVWDGHAWIEFDQGYIGEPSLFRTARGVPAHSNLRMNLQRHGLLEKGAIFISAIDAMNGLGLKYSPKSYLQATAFPALIHGLEAMNAN